MLLPAGSRFILENVSERWSTTSGSQIVFKLRMLTPDEYYDFELWDIGLIDYGPDPLRLRADLIEEAAADGRGL